LQDSKEVFWSNIVSFVVNIATSVNVLTVRLIEEFAWDRVLLIICDIIIGHQDDIVCGETVLYEDLVSVADVCLMSIVPEAIRASDEEGPVVDGVS